MASWCQSSGSSSASDASTRLVLAVVLVAFVFVVAVIDLVALGLPPSRLVSPLFAASLSSDRPLVVLFAMRAKRSPSRKTEEADHTSAKD